MSKSDFTKAVYAYVATIPRGQTRSYADVAKAIGRPHAARAVGTVLGKNTDPDVPCHRVIRTNGQLGGYRDGEAAKARILAQERCDTLTA